MGLSDGDTMERLWSYLRRFARMTKEMRPAHCIDVLTSALTYYGIQTKEKLGETTMHIMYVCPHTQYYTNQYFVCACGCFHACSYLTAHSI